jgi:hypothetical protein
MRRREFIRLLGSAAWPLLPSSLLWSVAARAQTPPPAQTGNAAAVGQVATVQGSATVTRGNSGNAVALQVSDPIFKNDTLETAANSALGVSFDDQTTFSLSASTRIVVNEFVYQEGGNSNAALFNVVIGTAAFVASEVAKTGDMKIATPVATLGIRGTTGIVDVPQSGAGPADEPRIKLYPDADGHVGRIEVFDSGGVRLGALTQGASAFALRPGAGGRWLAVPFQSPPGEAARDRGVLQRLTVSHNIGRRMTIERMRSRGRNQGGRNQGGRNQGGRNNRGQGGHQQQPFNRNTHPGGPRPQGNPHGGRGRRQ